MEQNTQQNVFRATPPKNWLVESILVTIFCCIVFGIIGIVNATQVNSRFAAGDIEGAERASREAGKWTKIGFWIAIGGWIIFILLAIFFGWAATFLNKDEYSFE